MKFIKILSVLSICSIVFTCCENKRLPIKVIETNNGYYEWYYYSLITSNGPDYIDYVNKDCKRTLIYSGHDLIDVNLSNNKIRIMCYQCDTLEFNPMYENQIEIINRDNYRELADSLLIRDSLRRNVKIKHCK